MLNQIALVGRLTKDVEVFTSSSGDSVTKFSLAFTQGKNADGSEDAGFIKVATFGNLATICEEWLSKGDKVAVTGRVAITKYTRKDDSTGIDPQILADNIEFIDVIKSKDDVEDDHVEETAPAPKEVKEEKVSEAPKQVEKPLARPTRNRR